MNPQARSITKPRRRFSHNRDEIHRLFFELRDRLGQTIVIVTHNDAISRMANRVLRLRDGVLVENEMNAAPVSAAELVW